MQERQALRESARSVQRAGPEGHAGASGSFDRAIPFSCRHLPLDCSGWVRPTPNSHQLWHARPIRDPFRKRERSMQAELPGYKGYTERDRYKLIPGVWWRPTFSHRFVVANGGRLACVDHECDRHRLDRGCRPWGGSAALPWGGAGPARSGRCHVRRCWPGPKKLVSSSSRSWAVGGCSRRTS
jgi:hypothetical protein